MFDTLELTENKEATYLSEIKDQKNREPIAKELTRFLADSYVLYLKSQNYHWNVTGINFKSLHEMFEEHYQDLAEAIDEIAERVRALGYMVPGGLMAFSDIASLEDDITYPDSKSMIKNLLEGHEKISGSAKKALKEAGKSDDEVTVDLLIKRVSFHQKTAWMLRSMLVE